MTGGENGMSWVRTVFAVVESGSRTGGRAVRCCGLFTAPEASTLHRPSR